MVGTNSRVLIPEPYPEENVRFVEENGIRFFQVGMPGNKVSMGAIITVSDANLGTFYQW